MVEGIHLVQEALSSRVDIECVAYDVEKGIPRNFVIYRIQDKVLNGLAYPMPSSRRSVTRRHRKEVFAVVRKEARQWQDLILRENGLVIVLDGLQDPGNVGTIIRSADAVGPLAWFWDAVARICTTPRRALYHGIPVSPTGARRRFAKHFAGSQGTGPDWLQPCWKGNIPASSMISKGQAGS